MRRHLELDLGRLQDAGPCVRAITAPVARARLPRRIFRHAGECLSGGWGASCRSEGWRSLCRRWHFARIPRRRKAARRRYARRRHRGWRIAYGASPLSRLSTRRMTAQGVERVMKASHFSIAQIRSRVEALGPWFHNLDLAGVRTAPAHFLGDYPAVKWRRFAGAIP